MTLQHHVQGFNCPHVLASAQLYRLVMPGIGLLALLYCSIFWQDQPNAIFIDDTKVFLEVSNPFKYLVHRMMVAHSRWNAVVIEDFSDQISDYSIKLLDVLLILDHVIPANRMIKWFVSSKLVRNFNSCHPILPTTLRILEEFDIWFPTHC